MPVTRSDYQRRGPRLLLVAVEADEVVGGYRGEVPEDEDEDQVLCHREAHHGTHEKQHEEIEARAVGCGPSLVLQVQRKVARGVDEHGEAYAGGEQGVERRQSIQGNLKT